MEHRKTSSFVFLSVLAWLSLAALAVPSDGFAAATFYVINGDGPGEGFNDPTPAAPVGGNPGTTLGEQRLNAFQFAADVWGASLDSDVPIYVLGEFDVLPCTLDSGTLGSAGPVEVWSDTPGAEIPGVWYPGPLAEKLAGQDFSPGVEDISGVFNSEVDGPVCFGDRSWYYGLDNQHGDDFDLITVLLHEIGHGLGVASYLNVRNGRFFDGRPDIYTAHIRDNQSGKLWTEMTDAERQASVVNINHVVWDGRNVTAAVPGILAPGAPSLRVHAPDGIGPFRIGPAPFGPALASPGVSGELVRALDAADAAGPTPLDACSPLINGGEVAGRIALVDRGTCQFTQKVRNAEDAGALAVLVVDNVPGGPPPALVGADPTLTIPAARLSLEDGQTLDAALAGSAGSAVEVTLGPDLTLRAGADADGRALLNALRPPRSGASISHFDPIAFPNLLMEPSISADLPHGLDLTLPLLTDLGWFSDRDGVPDGRDACIGSDTHASVVIDGCDSGVPNTVFADGCRISDGIAACAEAAGPAGSHGAFVRCVAHYGEALEEDGTITGVQKGAIQSCAGGASIP